MNFLTKNMTFAVTLALLCPAASVSAFDWQVNEIQYQYGTLDNITAAGGGDQEVSTWTFQHADGWKYGDNFLFIDFTDGNETHSDVYGEFYANFSMGKITGKEWRMGPIKDVGLVAGYNYAKDAKVKKYLPGVRLSWDIPGFAFLNTDFMAYIDDSRGVNHGGAPIEGDNWMVDVSWAYPFNYGEHYFSIEGHAEYIDKRHNEFSGRVSDHFLAQPQFRYDLGRSIWGVKDTVFVGIEYQYWVNKLGDEQTDENAPQLLLVWRM